MRFSIRNNPSLMLSQHFRGNSMDHSREERIAARRLRIQQKLAMKQGAGAAGSRGAAITMEEKAVVRIGECACGNGNAPTLRALW
jgi:hypothetical protein